jgi:hypothetical protein
MNWPAMTGLAGPAGRDDEHAGRTGARSGPVRVLNGWQACGEGTERQSCLPDRLDRAEGRFWRMRRSGDQVGASQGTASSDEAGSVAAADLRYLRPKILVVDAPEIVNALHQRGYAAVSGSFGQPVIVPAGDSCVPLNLTAAARR